MTDKKRLDNKFRLSDNYSQYGGVVMSEEQFQAYLERLKTLGEELASNPEKAQRMLESAGICDSSGELTDLYKD